MTRNDDRHLSGTDRPLEGGHGPSFSALLRAHRAAAGLTQEDLAARAGMSVRGLRYLEGGFRRPHPATIRRLGVALSHSSADVQALVDAARGRTATPPASLGNRPGARRLRVPAAPLIGREKEVAAVGRLLQRDDVQLLTLTGPGGVGKARLALEVAEACRRGSDADVVWVPLAALAAPEQVPPAIAQAIELMENGARPLAESLAAALRDRQALLVLDNFEHVAAASSAIAVLLEACAALKVLATSRAPLRLAQPGAGDWR